MKNPDLKLVSLILFSCTVFVQADRQTADMLARTLNNCVSGNEVHPTWAPDDSALYLHEAEQIFRIDTATGKRKTMINYDAIAKKIGNPNPRIERFTITDESDFTCLISADGKYYSIGIDGTHIRDIAPENDPFALPSFDHPVRSGDNGRETAVIFINNTDHPVQLFWTDSSGIQSPYNTLEPGAFYRQHTFAGHAWFANGLGFVASDEPGLAYLSPVQREPSSKPKRAESEQWTVSFRDNNLSVTERSKPGKKIQLTTDGTADCKYCGPTFESPDGRYLVAMKEQAGENRTIDLIEAAPRDQLQPRTLAIPYSKPGDRLAITKPVLFDLQTMKAIPLDDELFPNPWSVSEFHWSPDSDRFFFLYNERGHQTARLIAVQSKTGKAATVVEEKSSTFIDWTNKLKVHHLDKTDEAIWMSERSGWNHLYLINRKSGRITPITEGEWVVRGIERIDEEKREILLRVGGIYPEQDPYYIHYVRVGFDGSGLTRLTEGNGTHTISKSPQGGYYVDSWSRVNLPPVYELHRTSDGKKIMELGRADISEMLKCHPHLPEPFTAKGRDGQTDIYGVIFRPSDFDPGKKYPVVEDIYAGPQDFFVPKEFSPWRGLQRLAELGFVVVKIDGMGTNWRSKAFHDVCFKNLKDAGFPDRIAWMKAAAKKYPWMDLSRVGVYGTSAGGQNAMRAVLDYADFYKAAYADCGCHDNRMDKTWWNEQWMGWPVDESYIASSNMEDAHKLAGKLFLTVGMMDSNVDPSSTMQVVEELIKENKDFELMVFPSGSHGAGMGTYGTRLREQFFIRWLQP
ncbi:MAG: prolyl oligopeptidase family serine peptidase [Pontiellaceae bacterium]|nr:prolyl oligopeptidase family serine peptidase [Pontiellaceae bacterium]MBN2784927.1 prolyl oligopeptidase family serine peptidase [Pontiellaceae bacterium]